MNGFSSPVDLRPDHLEIVQDILREHLPMDVKVWVFGSRANWTTKDSSDLDLAVEGAARLDNKAMSELEMAFEESDLPYFVDVVDLNTVGDAFKQIVEEQRTPFPTDGDDTKRNGNGRVAGGDAWGDLLQDWSNVARTPGVAARKSIWTQRRTYARSFGVRTSTIPALFTAAYGTSSVSRPIAEAGLSPNVEAFARLEPCSFELSPRDIAVARICLRWIQFSSTGTREPARG